MVSLQVIDVLVHEATNMFQKVAVFYSSGREASFVAQSHGRTLQGGPLLPLVINALVAHINRSHKGVCLGLFHPTYRGNNLHL